MCIRDRSVGGLQCLHVKLTAGILHTLCSKGKHLQLTVMGGGHGAALHVVQEGKEDVYKRQAHGHYQAEQ